MKKLFAAIFVFFVISCNKNNDSAKISESLTDKYRTPADVEKKVIFKEENNNAIVTYHPDIEKICSNAEYWYKYYYTNTKLSQDFIGVHTDSSNISRYKFLTLLSSGKFIPIKIKTIKSKPVFVLYKLKNKNKTIQSLIKYYGSLEKNYLEMEGHALPSYSFVDLNGKLYNEYNTKGKFLIIKCWFVSCVPCVKEFPLLNNIVDSYKQRNDIAFISLAADSKKKLRSFLKDNEFKYAVIPNQNSYMQDKLHITAYPTHILIDKKGNIVKIVNSIDELLPALRKQLSSVDTIRKLNR